jgi:putative sterol carrier protein
MPVDIQKLFAEELPAAMITNENDALDINTIFQFNITGPTGGSWILDCSEDTGPSCVAGKATNAQVTITMADEDFQKLAEDSDLAMPLFLQGKLQLDGDQMLALKLQKLFELVP